PNLPISFLYLSYVLIFLISSIHSFSRSAPLAGIVLLLVGSTFSGVALRITDSSTKRPNLFPIPTSTMPATEILPEATISNTATLMCINDVLRDDELRMILSKMETEKDKELFGMVCKRWLHLQSTERRKICARAGPLMLRKMADRFTRLVELDLSQCVSRSFYPGVTDADLSVIANGFTSLRVLNLHSCKGISDAGLKAIGSCLSSLQALDVSYCRKVSDEGISAVAFGCSDLRSLQLAGCRFITDEALESLSNNCHNLELLCLQGCMNITDSGLSTLVSSCGRISYLDLNKCSNIGDSGISSVSKSCSSIRTLKLLDCCNVSNESILSLASFCRNLETLIVGGCRDISDESIELLACSCSDTLKNLRMDWCLKITDSSVNCILSKCKKLVALDIGCCEEVTDVAFGGLTALNKDMPLRILKASNCPKITVAGIAMLLDSCKYLEYLDIRSCPHVTKDDWVNAGLEFRESCKVNFTGSLNENDVLI
ncbi:hypothetical protein V2J09_004039, partial [Rumex salicifolius]